MSRAGKVSLRELMGKNGGKATLKDLPELLGERMPDLPRNNVGKHRLLTALKGRFGNGYRILPGVSDILKEFDEDVRFEGQVQKLKRLRVK